MKTKTSSLMDGKFNPPPPTRPFGPSAQAEENHRIKSEQHLRSGLRWFLGCIVALIIFLLAFYGQMARV